MAARGWARRRSRAGADRLVAEANEGGAMVESVLRAASVTLPLRLVDAARGKAARAEPVGALFEAGRAGFAGRFAALEEQLACFTAGGWHGNSGGPDGMGVVGAVPGGTRRAGGAGALSARLDFARVFGCRRASLGGPAAWLGIPCPVP